MTDGRALGSRCRQAGWAAGSLRLGNRRTQRRGLGRAGDGGAQAPAWGSGRKQPGGAASCEELLWRVWPGLGRPARRQ